MLQLKAVNIEITSVCSLACPICFFKGTQNEYMEECCFKKIVREAKELGVNQIMLSGGEPMEHSKIFSFIRFIKENGMQVVLSSSGIKIKEETAKLLKNSGLDCCFISLCGSKAEIHNKYRQSFELTIAAMEHLAKVKQEFRINWIACYDNIHDFHNVIKLAKALGAQGIDILSQKPSNKEFKVEPLDEKKLRELSNKISPYIHDGFITVEGCFDILKFQSKAFLKSGMATGCAAGRCFLAVKTDGRYMPCTHLPEYAEKADSLRDYWENSMVLKKFRTKTKNPFKNCSKCARQGLCSPCRVMAACLLFTPKKNPPQFLSIYRFHKRVNQGGKI